MTSQSMSGRWRLVLAGSIHSMTMILPPTDKVAKVSKPIVVIPNSVQKAFQGIMICTGPFVVLFAL